jgi:hypothetical protein
LIDRRAVIKRSLILGGALLSAPIVGCRPAPPSSPVIAQSPDAPEATAVATPSKLLLAYFSRPGENYYYGDRIDLDVGNTEVVANMIASTVAVDVYRIEASDRTHTATKRQSSATSENKTKMRDHLSRGVCRHSPLMTRSCLEVRSGTCGRL